MRGTTRLRIRRLWRLPLLGLTGLLTLLVLAACGSDDALITLPDGTIDDVTAMYVYVANNDDATISIFQVDLDSGELSEAHSPEPAGLLPIGLAVHPSGQFLFATSRNDDTVSVYEIDPDTGGLSETPNSPFGTGAAPPYLAFHPSGEFVFVVVPGDGEVYMHEVDPDSGDMAGSSNSDTTVSAGTGVAVHPSGDYFYGPDNSGFVTMFTFDDGSGNVVAAQNYNPPSASQFLQTAIHPSGDHLYLAEVGNDQVYTLDIDPGDGTVSDNGTLTVDVAQANPDGVAVHPSGDFVYVAQTSIVEGFQVQGDGSLGNMPGSPFTKGGGSASAAVDPTGTWLYVSNDTDATLSVYEIDPDDGSLTELAGSPVNTGNDPQHIAVFAVTE